MLDQATTAGATPVAGGATPPQTTPVSPAATTPPTTPTTPATGDAALGDAGKRALDAERTRAEAAEKAAKDLAKRIEELEAQGKSEAEKAIDAAKKEGEAAAGTRYQARIRKAEVRAALVAAGIDPSVLDLALEAPDFAGLKVSDEGEVDGVDAAVAAFKKARESLFGTRSSGSFDTGTGGRTAKPMYTKAQINDPAFYDAHRDDILAAMSEPGQPRLSK